MIAVRGIVVNESIAIRRDTCYADYDRVCASMKKMILIFAMILTSGISSAFASGYVDACYKSENVEICQFLGFTSMFDCYEKESKTLEEKFNQFCWFTDRLLEISYETGKKVSFYSEPVASELRMGETSFFFHPAGMKGKVEEAENQFFCNDYNNPYFIVPYVCNKLNLGFHEGYAGRNRIIYSLEITSELSGENEIKLDDSDCSLIFFYPSGDLVFSPCFELGTKNYIGFYYSESDAAVMKKLLKEKYSLECEIMDFPCSFELISDAYFKQDWLIGN